MHDYKFCWVCTLCITAILVGAGLEIWALSYLF